MSDQSKWVWEHTTPDGQIISVENDLNNNLRIEICPNEQETWNCQSASVEDMGAIDGLWSGLINWMAWKTRQTLQGSWTALMPE